MTAISILYSVSKTSIFYNHGIELRGPTLARIRNSTIDINGGIGEQVNALHGGESWDGLTGERLITNSILNSTEWSIRNDSTGEIIKVANSMLTGGINNMGTVICFDNYNADLIPVSCP